MVTRVVERKTALNGDREESGPQPPTAPMKPRERNGDRGIHHLGDLLVRRPLDVGVVDDSSPFLGKCLGAAVVCLSDSEPDKTARPLTSICALLLDDPFPVSSKDCVNEQRVRQGVARSHRPMPSQGTQHADQSVVAVRQTG